MSSWLVATVASLPPLAIAVFCCCRGSLAHRLPAASFAAALGTVLLVEMSFALNQPASIDLALTAGLLSLPATLLFAAFVERWL